MKKTIILLTFALFLQKNCTAQPNYFRKIAEVDSVWRTLNENEKLYVYFENKKKCYYDFQGNQLSQKSKNNEDIEILDNKYIKTKCGERYGIATIKGEVLVPCEFDNFILTDYDYEILEKRDSFYVYNFDKKKLFWITDSIKIKEKLSPKDTISTDDEVEIPEYNPYHYDNFHHLSKDVFAKCLYFESHQGESYYSNCSLYDSEGRVINPDQNLSMPTSHSKSSIIAAHNANGILLFDSKGKLLQEYKGARSFYYTTTGNLIFSLNDSLLLLDNYGNLIKILPQVEIHYAISNADKTLYTGLFYAYHKNKNHGVINENLDTVVPLRYKSVYKYDEYDGFDSLVIIGEMGHDWQGNDLYDLNGKLLATDFSLKHRDIQLSKRDIVSLRGDTVTWKDNNGKIFHVFDYFSGYEIITKPDLDLDTIDVLEIEYNNIQRAYNHKGKMIGVFSNYYQRKFPKFDITIITRSGMATVYDKNHQAKFSYQSYYPELLKIGKSTPHYFVESKDSVRRLLDLEGKVIFEGYQDYEIHEDNICILKNGVLVFYKVN